MPERNYAFREKLQQVHPCNIADAAIWKNIEGCVIDDTWEIIAPLDESRLINYIGRDFCDFLDTSLSVYPRYRRVDDFNKDLADPTGKIILTTEEKSGIPLNSSDPMSYRLTVAHDHIILCGKCDRGLAQGCYYLEDIMRENSGPVIPFTDTEHAPLFSPRMTHSGFEQDTFPDAYLQRIAHYGMDAVIVFVNGPDRICRGQNRPDTLWHEGKEYCDLENLAWRASGFGIDVYAYSFFINEKHPDEEDASAYYDSTFGELFRRAPSLKGIIFVGEAFEFPSRDPHTIGHRCQIKLPDDKGFNVGWFPCSDYPAFVTLVRDVIRRQKPDADIILWSYNWGFQPKDLRLRLIRNLPKDITLLVTYDMFEVFVGENGERYKVDDYSLSYEGPGEYYITEAEEAAKLGLKLYTMANTGGRTWDHGAAPYLPMPQQWIRRYKGLRDSHIRHNLSGIMESHHYGWVPSFISELAKFAFWSYGTDVEKKLFRIAVRDFGDGAEDAIRAWELMSEGIRSVIAAGADQSGPGRIGVGYPLVFDQDELNFPSDDSLFHACDGQKNGICNFQYSERPLEQAGIVALRLSRAKETEKKYAQAVCHMTNAAQQSTSSKKADASLEVGLLRYYLQSIRTVIHVKQWNILKAIQSASDREAAYRLLSPQVVGLLRGGSMESIQEAMKKVAWAEIKNAEEAIQMVVENSLLGFEATMGYVSDAEHIKWKIDVTRKSLRRALHWRGDASC